MAIRRDAIDVALRHHGVSDESLKAMRSAASKQGIPIFEAARGAVSGTALAAALSEASGLPIVEKIDDAAITPELIRELPLAIARDRGVLPLYRSGEQLVVGIAGLDSLDLLDDLRVILGRAVRPVIVPHDVLFKAMNAAYDRASKDASSVLGDVEDEFEDEAGLALEADLLDGTDDEAPVIRFVNALLTQAIKERASDIHIEPFEKELIIRFRVDGVLHEAIRPPSAVKNALVSRVKIMAGLNIAERRLPQDGRIRRRMGGREIDLRVSTVPVRYGERVVMRILEKGKVISLDSLGMPEDISKLPRQMDNPIKYGFRAVLLGAENDRGQVKGFALLLHAPDVGLCFLDYIATSPRITSGGVGGALYERVREEASALGAHALYFECLPDDPALSPMHCTFSLLGDTLYVRVHRADLQPAYNFASPYTLRLTPAP